ncbi:MAG: GNAT family N-acetyltransferase, partial [Geobacter sp.]|nr:GNAT family N-acetyltransferase [Geobacter sp.]
MEPLRPDLTGSAPESAPTWDQDRYPFIRNLTPSREKAIAQQPLLNIDSLVIPSPYVLDSSIDIDYGHSYVWEERGELLGYMTVYATPDRMKFHIYRQVTSPFGRGKGIGTAFASCLAGSVHPEARIYLYVWDKLLSSIGFFKSKGFMVEDQVVYRKMKFLLLSVTAGVLRQTATESARPDTTVVEELSKVRHDVKKSLRVLNDMAAMMSVDNVNRIAEDINREARVMLNILNMYEDTVHLAHKVSLKEILTERVIPYIEAVDSACRVQLTMTGRIEPVNGSYVTVSRALINIVANALDAIREAGRPGRIEFELAQHNDQITLAISDNGAGIPADKLRPGPDRVPLFVGHTTKGPHEGEGLGTRQIYAAFGAENIRVESEPGRFTRWTITLGRSVTRENALHTDLGTRYVRFIKSTQKIAITAASPHTEIAAFIWQLRKMELFSYDLIYHFSRYNNVRDIFQSVLLYRYGGRSFDTLKESVRGCRLDDHSIGSWLLGICRRISRNETWLREQLPFDAYKDVLFQSYGQALDRTMIFTLDPETGRFFATDRKLAEHLDFVPYLGKPRDELLRGELVGDVRNLQSPIYLGVWSVRSREDLHAKLGIIRRGARQLLATGLAPEKRIAFYNTTYN